MASTTYMTSPLTMNNLELPSTAPLNTQRRMTSPSLVPPEASGLPESPSERRDLRPPSPLRNGVTYDPSTGEFSDHASSHQTDDDDRQWGRQRAHSPTPSVTQFATNFAQRVSSLVAGGPVSRRTVLPTDAELEAEAEKERQRSLREAERIMMQEESERRFMEDRIMSMIEETMAPPAKPRTSNPPSPSSSNKENGGGWLSVVKNKLTPTKEPLTPAQQIIQETKAKEKDKKKSKDKEWPSSANGKFSDPAFVALASSNVTPPRPQAQNFSSSPTSLQRPISQVQSAEWSPAFSRTDSPAREGPPVYAQFNAQGVLDISSTLLTVAKRFEKLEKWTVSHVRALEDRMSDVERWLVDKEKEKDLEKERTASKSDVSSVNSETKSSATHENQDTSEIREELAELQGRVTELGREMAKYSSTVRISASASLLTPPLSTPLNISAPATSGRSLPAIPAQMTRTPSNSSQNSSQTPRHRGVSPTSSANAAAIKSRTRLPYPTGDYAIEEPLSPSTSPPSSVTQSSRIRPLSVSGLKPSTYSTNSVTQPLVAPLGDTRALSPVLKEKGKETVSRPANILRLNSTSPTPAARKRYTVALGGPLVSPGSQRTTSPSPSTENDTKGDTNGKSATRNGLTPASTVRLTPNNPRIRAQSTYGSPAGYSRLSPSPSSSPSTSPLKLRLRTRSIDQLAPKNKPIGLGITDASKFVDPLVVRRQERESNPPIRSPKVSNGINKVPFGELLAFFDGDRRNGGA